MRYLFAFICCLASLLPAFPQEVRQSVLKDGEWFQIAVRADSVYKIDHTFLASMGIDPAGIDPRKIQIWSNPFGLLPQPNSATRPVDLKEISIFVSGESDGQFNSEDYILFYGRGPDRLRFDVNDNDVDYTYHYGDDETSYFLTIGVQDGKRIPSVERPVNGSSEPPITTYWRTVLHERNEENSVQSGRIWFERLSAINDNMFGFSFPGRVPESSVYITSQPMIFSYADEEISLAANGTPAGTATVGAVPQGIYSSKGRIARHLFETTVPIHTQNPDTVILQYTFTQQSEVTRGFLDFVAITAQCDLKLHQAQLPFTIHGSSDQRAIQIGAVQGNEQVWNVTDPIEPESYIYDFTGDITFGSSNDTLTHYVVFDPDRLQQKPLFIGRVENQNIQGLGVANLIIISNQGFAEEAERLADLRRSEGMSVHVVTPEQIYNEFSSGMRDITALRDYIKYLYDLDHSEDGIRYVLVFGKGTYNFKSPVNISRNYVPIYESRNSLHPIYSYASDDYLVLLENHEGEWIESAAGDETMDLGVGRIPVKDRIEAQHIVDKYYQYAEVGESFGDWRTRIAFVADDGDINLHLRQANRLADTVLTKMPSINNTKIFLDAFEQDSIGVVQRASRVNARISEAIRQGTLIVNYTGHGNEVQWAQERILDEPMIESWNNHTYLPLFITATCEFGRHDDPNRSSAGERVIMRPAGGAIALVTTARPVFASQNFLLNNAFYQSILTADGKKRLGDVFMDTKNNSLAGSVNRNFSLLGDPSLQLLFPQEEVLITAINNKTAGADTIQALSQVTISGEIRSNGAAMNTFNGTIFLKLFEKPDSVTTRGDESNAFTYQHYANRLFSGKASVSDGRFDFSFIAPLAIADSVGYGKITAYAFDSEQEIDAAGSAENIPIGGRVQNPPVDTEPPAVTLFMEDSTFTNGGVVKPNTLLLARLSDESGISTTNAPGQEMQAILDDTVTFSLYEYYTADVDTYQNGTILFPIENLEQGPHTMEVHVRDIHGNAGSANIQFVVSEKGALVVDQLRSYPNPVHLTHDGMTFKFRHNRPGEDLDVTLQVYDGNGAMVKETDYEIYSSFTEADGLEWDARLSTGGRIRAGVYYYRVIVRSTVDGASTQQFQKFVIY